MPCNHKFQQDLQLQHLDYEPTTLIVGTFNPAWPNNNNAEWFYGRTHDANGNQNNNFWAVLPRIYERESMIYATPEEWRQFCHDNQVAITDLITSVNDAEEHNLHHQEIMAGFADKALAENFHNFTFTNVVGLLQTHSTIQNVYLTRGATPAFWSRLWQPVRQYAALNGLRIRTLLTPSGYAFYQQGRYNNANPEAPITELEDFVLMRWQERWHPLNIHEA